MKFNLLALSLLLVAGAAFSAPAQAASPTLQGIICDPYNVSTEDGAFVRFVNSQAFGHLNLTFGGAVGNGECGYDGYLVGAKVTAVGANANYWQCTVSGSEGSNGLFLTFVTTPSGITIADDNTVAAGPFGPNYAGVYRWYGSNNDVPPGSKFAAIYLVDGGEDSDESFQDTIYGFTVNGTPAKQLTSQVPIYDCTAFDYYYCD